MREGRVGGGADRGAVATTSFPDVRESPMPGGITRVAGGLAPRKTWPSVLSDGRDDRRHPR